MTLVAISAPYGAAGGTVGPALAERLGVPFVDRAIPHAVAQRLDVSVDDAAAHDDEAAPSWLERILRGFLGVDAGIPAPLPSESFTSDDFRRATEEVLLQQAATGEGVILGRAATIVLREDPRVLRVRLHGPPERRVRQAMRTQGIDEASARRTMEQLDRTHATYVREFYGLDVSDASLYHVVLDSTVIPLDTCVNVLAAVAREWTPFAAEQLDTAR
jgi:cytidylate kinase